MADLGDVLRGTVKAPVDAPNDAAVPDVWSDWVDCPDCEGSGGHPDNEDKWVECAGCEGAEGWMA